VEKIEINGRSYNISITESKNRNAYGKLREDVIEISIPSRWPKKEREKTAMQLLKRTIKEIERGRWTVQGSRKLAFAHGQRINAIGKSFEIVFRSGGRVRSKTKGNVIEVIVPEHESKDKLASELVVKQLIKNIKPEIVSKVEKFNSEYFNAKIPRITLRDNLTIWGSCSYTGSINLNLRLVFMPERILDYVIVHELAHTKYKSHGVRFWGLVEKVLPDYKERREWLRDHGWAVAPEKKIGQYKITDFFILQ